VKCEFGESELTELEIDHIEETDFYVYCKISQSSSQQVLTGYVAGLH